MAWGSPRRLGFVSQLLQSQFVRFCIIGAVGFVTDASVLMALIHWGSLHPLAARLGSFACAVVVTFELNRRWTFRDSGERAYLGMLAKYLGVQGIGFILNLAIYTGIYFLLRPASSAPLIALALASIVALFLNYLGARLVVFQTKRGSMRT
ncbi:GtrA family protein [Lichenihabitans sp. Uapishka_5]|nr:GtrA family protein [Lichenihabitans sp. Uapishka_5]